MQSAEPMRSRAHRVVRSSLAVAVVVSFSMTLTARESIGQCRYEVVPMPVEECGAGGPITPNQRIRAIRDTEHGVVLVGEIAVCYEDGPELRDQPMCRRPGEMEHRIDLLSTTTNGQAYDISVDGTIVGFFAGSGFGRRPFVLPWGGEPTILPIQPDADLGEPYGVNDHGIIVGYAERSSGIGYTPCWWDADGSFHPIDIGDYTFGFARDVGNDGTIVGTIRNSSTLTTGRAFVHRSGKMSIFGPHDDEKGVSAKAVNDRGDFIYVAYLHSGGSDWRRRPYVVRDGRATMLPVPSDAVGGIPDDITNGGLVLGEIEETPAGDVAVLWHHGDVFVVGNLIDDDDFDVQRVSSPKSITESGHIVAQVSAEPSLPGHVGTLVPIDRPKADLTGDCRVDDRDLQTLLEVWGRDMAFADLDDSGVVDAADLLTLLGAWGER